MLDAAAAAVPAKPASRKRRTLAPNWQPWWNPRGQELRDWRLAVMSDLREAERSGREEDAQNLRVEYRDAQKRLKKHARDSRRAFTAKRNETLREYASDPAKAKLFWRTVLGDASKHAAKATAAIVELWSSDERSTTTKAPSEVATMFGREFSRIGADTPHYYHTFDMSEIFESERQA